MTSKTSSKLDSASRLDSLPDQRLADALISSKSRWHSEIWHFDNLSHGARSKASQLIWRISLDDKTLLTDKKHAHLLDWLRRVAWGLAFAPGDGATALSPGSMAGVSHGLSKVVPWLVRNSIRWPHEITPDVLDHFLEDLVEASSENTGTNSARLQLMVFYYIWRQRKALEKAGIPPMPMKPWPNLRGAQSVAEFAPHAMAGEIAPLPDEVAVPLLNRAAWFLETPAKDILMLRDACNSAYIGGPKPYKGRPGTSPVARSTHQRRAAISFEFRTPPGDSFPWHDSLENYRHHSGASRVMNRVRALTLDLQAACCLILQGFTGMRASELCGLRIGMNRKTGLPVDVELRKSPSGLNEEFVIRGELSKGLKHPASACWLLGSRRIGNGDLPTAVLALITLNQLMAPYRELISSDRLLVTMRSRIGLPRTSKAFTRMTTVNLMELYRGFIREWVDLSCLPDESHRSLFHNDLVGWRESKGVILTTHQLRKTYAQYVLAVHSDLLPAVKRQFHHVNMSVTENYYWGGNSPQIEPTHSVSRQLTARLIFDATQGRTILGGKMGKQMQSEIESLKIKVANLDTQQAWIRVSKWVADADIHANHSQHGTCIPISHGRMECWKRADNDAPGALEPNYLGREPSVCAGCSCFVMHESSIPFWKERYVDYTTSLLAARQSGQYGPEFREIERRARMARNLLKNVGVELSHLDSSALANRD